MATTTLNRTNLNYWAAHRVLARHFWRVTYSGNPARRRMPLSLPANSHLRRDVGLSEPMPEPKPFQHWF